MGEALAEIAGIRITVKMAAAAIALAVLLVFAALWLRDRKKRAGASLSFGDRMNGLGFGLLPALAVWKAFEHFTAAGKGAEITEPLPALQVLTENGRYAPCMIEMILALACFAAVCLWLMIRKPEMAERGDLLMTAVCLWAAVRAVTAGFRPRTETVFRYACCAAMLICLAVWTHRRLSVRPGLLRAVSDGAAAALCTAMIVVTTEGILSVGSGIGDLAVITGCAALTAALTLIAGSDCRKLLRPESD